MTLLLLASFAFSAPADPTTVIPGASPAPAASPVPAVESHITVVRPGSGDTLPGATNIVVTISCQPGTPSKFNYLAPELVDYTSENAAFRAAAEKRSDIHLVANIQNATPAETLAWLKTLHEEFDEPVRQIMVTVSCPAWGGDQDEELLLMNDGTLSFTDLLTAVAPIARSSIWFLDASRNVSGALTENVSSFGPTADDVVKYGIVPDAFAVSSSAPGKYGGPGLIGAAAKVLAQSKGGPIDLQTLYHLGVKPAVPTLELFTSMGVMEPDAWNGNLTRPVLPGGSLIVPVTEVKPPVARPRLVMMLITPAEASAPYSVAAAGPFTTSMDSMSSGERSFRRLTDCPSTL